MRKHINPPTLVSNPAFTQVVLVEGPAKIAYIGGQNAVNTEGEVIGENLAEQTKQVLENIAAAATAAGGSLHDIVKWTIYVVDGQPIQEGLAAFGEAWGQSAPAPAVTVMKVAGLANPKFLVEIEAVAAIEV